VVHHKGFGLLGGITDSIYLLHYLNIIQNLVRILKRMREFSFLKITDN
jgi:hypothetical protein